MGVGYGKGRATSYTDYYNQNDDTPQNAYGVEINISTRAKKPQDNQTENNIDESQMSMVERRKAALRRRLKAKKAGM